MQARVFRVTQRLYPHFLSDSYSAGRITFVVSVSPVANARVVRKMFRKRGLAPCRSRVHAEATRDRILTGMLLTAGVTEYQTTSVALEKRYNVPFSLSMCVSPSCQNQLSVSASGPTGALIKSRLVGCVASTSVYELYHHSTPRQVRGRSLASCPYFPAIPVSNSMPLADKPLAGVSECIS